MSELEVSMRGTLRTLIIRLALSTAIVPGAAIALEGCACNSPTVAFSQVTVLDPDNAGVAGANVTLSRNGQTGTLTSQALADGGVVVGVYSGAVNFTGGDNITLRVEAPGFRTVERVLTGDEIGMPTGCGYAANLTVRMERQ